MIRVDSISVEDETEATKLMLHHLHMAAILFEATHDDKGAFAKELILKMAPIEQRAMAAFITYLVAEYEMFDKEDE